MTDYTRFNYILSKVTKLRKFVTEATNLETMQKYCDEARDGKYTVARLHAPVQWLVAIKAHGQETFNDQAYGQAVDDKKGAGSALLR